MYMRQLLDKWSKILVVDPARSYYDAGIQHTPASGHLIKTMRFQKRCPSNNDVLLCLFMLPAKIRKRGLYFILAEFLA